MEDLINSRVSLNGKIDKEIFYNEESSFGIYLFFTDEDVWSDALTKQPFGKRKYGTIAGNIQRLSIGTSYMMELEEKFNRKYNQLQFSPIRVYEKIPSTQEEKQIFLESILTKIQAQTLLEAYPDIIQEIIDGAEIDITNLKNINEQRFERIKDRIIENYVLSDLLVFLTPYGITFSQIKKISTLSESPNLIKDMIIKNPYVLVKINGLGFIKVDSIALKMKPEMRKSEERVNAFLEYVLDSEGDSNGHTWLLKSDIVAYARKMIPECVDILKSIFSREEGSELLHIDGDKVGRKYDYNVELNIFKELERINNAEKLAFDRPTEEQIIEILKQTEEQQGFELSREQRETMFSLSTDANVIIVSGKSGSGKTTAVNTISNIFERCQKNRAITISQIALSAKASIRMRQVTKRHSTTIHKFLYDLNCEANLDNNVTDRVLTADIDEENMNRMIELENIRKSDIVIIDEFSMVNIYLTLQVLKQVKTGAVIIFVFDYAQLPAIGAGAVAYDLLELSNYNKSKYVEVHRQGQKSGILMDADTITKQQSPIRQFEKSITNGELQDMTYLFRTTAEDINVMAIKAFMSGVAKFGIDNINIICPRKDKVLNSAEELNYKIQELLIPKGSVIEFSNPITKKDFRLGDRVIHKKNLPQLGVYNGEMGVVIAIDDSKNSKYPVKVKFEYGDESKVVEYDIDSLKYLQLSYALTVHSYQGSENQAIIVVLDSSSHILLDNTMLYTAITRAKERCIVISDPKSFTRCINEHKTLIRNTWLKDILKNEGDWL